MSQIGGSVIESKSHGLDSYSSFKAHNRASKLRSISSNIIHHPEGRSELRDALMCEIGF